MKRHFFLSLFFLTISTNVVLAQSFDLTPPLKKNVLKTFPLGFINKAKVGYEYALNENFSLGGNVALYYMLFKGFTFGPTARVYFSGKAPEGFCLQLQAHYFATSTTLVFEDENFFGGKDRYTYQRTATGVGGGLGFGYQLLFGKSQNISLDVMGGFKFLPVPERAFYARHVSLTGEVKELDYDFIWYLTGPGSFVNCHISVGFLF